MFEGAHAVFDGCALLVRFRCMGESRGRSWMPSSMFMFWWGRGPAADHRAGASVLAGPGCRIDGGSNEVVQSHRFLESVYYRAAKEQGGRRVGRVWLLIRLHSPMLTLPGILHWLQAAFGGRWHTRPVL